MEAAATFWGLHLRDHLTCMPVAAFHQFSHVHGLAVSLPVSAWLMARVGKLMHSWGCPIGALGSVGLGCRARLPIATSFSLGRVKGLLIGTKDAPEKGGRPELQTFINARRR